MSRAAMVVMSVWGADLFSWVYPVFMNHHLMVCRHRVVRVLIPVHWSRFIRAQHASCDCALDGQQHRQQNQQPNANFSHG